MPRMLTIEDVELEGKRVFVRVDINTPVHPETGQLIEQTRLEEAAITIRDLTKSRVVVGSHQGRVGRSDYIGMEKHAAMPSTMPAAMPATDTKGGAK